MSIVSGILEYKHKIATVWKKADSVEKLSGITIGKTLTALKRNPSSDDHFLDNLEEISLGGSASTEHVKKMLKSVAVAKGWLPAVKEKHVTIEHNARRYSLEVSTIQTWDELKQAVDEKFKLPQPIKELYTIQNDVDVSVIDVQGLCEGLLYHVVTVNDKQTTKFSTMDEFFDLLKTKQGKSDAQVSMAKEKLEAQGISFEQLMETGDLALTDDKLEKDGISQGGLRTAILSLIKRNRVTHSLLS